MFQYQQGQNGPPDSIGIGSFAPVDLRPSSAAFEYTTGAPKPGWARTGIVRRFGRALVVPVRFETDVNAAALGEHRSGTDQGLDNTFVYFTVGTWIGGGGLASGPTIGKRWDKAGETLSAYHPAWRLEADYVASGLSNVIYPLSPRRMIIGGGVMQQAQLFLLIARKVQALINGYVNDPAIVDEVKDCIVPPLGSRSSVLGALALAQQAE